MRVRRIVHGAVLVLVLTCLAAVIAQDWLGATPFGVVNRDAAQYQQLALASGLGLGAIAAVLACDLAFGRPRWLARLLRRVVVVAVMLEGILVCVDLAFVSRN